MPRIDVGTAIDDIKDEAIQPIPAGAYNTKVEVAELRDNKAGDAKLVYLEYSVQDEPYVGRKLFDRLSMKPKALWKLKRFLVAAQVPYDGSNFATEDILGAKVTLQVSTGTYNGKATNEVEDYIVK